MSLCFLPWFLQVPARILSVINIMAFKSRQQKASGRKGKLWRLTLPSPIFPQVFCCNHLLSWPLQHSRALPMQSSSFSQFLYPWLPREETPTWSRAHPCEIPHFSIQLPVPGEFLSSQTPLCPLFLPYQVLTISPDLFSDPLTTLLTSSLPLLLSIFHSSIGLISLKQSFTHIMPLIKNLNGSLLPPGYMPKSLAWHSRPSPSGSKQPSQDYYLLPHSMNLLYQPNQLTHYCRDGFTISACVKEFLLLSKTYIIILLLTLKVMSCLP